GRNCEPHRHIIRRRDELGLLGAAYANGSKDGVAHICYHATMFVEMQRKNAKDIDYLQRIGAFRFVQRFGNSVRIWMIEMFLVDLCARERFQKIRELNGVVTMILNAYTLGRGEYRSTTIELCGVKSHAHIGDEGAQHQHKIRRLDVLADML